MTEPQNAPTITILCCIMIFFLNSPKLEVYSYYKIHQSLLTYSQKYSTVYSAYVEQLCQKYIIIY